MSLVDSLLEPFLAGTRTATLAPASWVRIIRYRHRATPLGVAFTLTRFSSPTRRFKTLYASENLDTAFAEISSRFGMTEIAAEPQTWMTEWVAATIEATRDLQLADLRSTNAGEVPSFSAVMAPKNHRLARTFSEALHERTQLDGLLYNSQHTGQHCIAIFDRSIQLNLVCRSPARKLSELEGLASLLKSPLRLTSEASGITSY